MNKKSQKSKMINKILLFPNLQRTRCVILRAFKYVTVKTIYITYLISIIQEKLFYIKITDQYSSPVIQGYITHSFLANYQFCDLLLGVKAETLTEKIYFHAIVTTINPYFQVLFYLEQHLPLTLLECVISGKRTKF